MDLGSAWMPGWAVGHSADRSLALKGWTQVRRAFQRVGTDLVGTLVHQGEDAVFTTYACRWALLLKSRVRDSHSKNDARGNPWTESLRAHFKRENHSHFIEAETVEKLTGLVDRQMHYHKRERRHSSNGNQPPFSNLRTEGFAA